MKILVTGAAGFIGSHLSEFLLQSKHQVVGMDNFDPFYPLEIKRQNLASLSQNSHFKFYEGSLLDNQIWQAIFSAHSFDCIVHLAAKAGVRPSLEDPHSYLETNIQGTLCLLEQMREFGQKKIVFGSSSSVYGTSADIPYREQAEIDQFISLYAFTKLSCEQLLALYHRIYHFSCINLRFFTVYGPRQRPDLAIHKFMLANMQGRPITMYGDGSMKRDFTYIQDIVAGIYSAIQRSVSEKKVCETYNLGNSSPVSLKELLQKIEQVTGKDFKIEHQPIPLGDVPQTFADLKQSQKILGYSPQTNLEQGLQLMWEWLLQVQKKEAA